MQSYKDWCQPSAAPDKDPCNTLGLSSLCANGWDLLTSTGFFADVLRRHFASADQIRSQDLKERIWTPSEKTGILIEEVFHWRGDVVGKRPAVIIKRNEFRTQEFLLNNLMGIGANLASTEHNVFWTGSHTLFCIAGTSAETDILATEVLEYMLTFSPVFRQQLGMVKFIVAEVGAVGLLEESLEHYVVPITVGYSYQYNWGLEEVSLPLKNISLGITVDGVDLGNCEPKENCE